MSLPAHAPLPANQQATADASTLLSFPKEGIRPEAFDFFINACGGRSKLLNLTTSEVCESYLLPFTKSNQISYTELLQRESQTKNLVGIANVFISHAWRFEFLALVDALLTCFVDQTEPLGGQERRRENEEGKEVYLWFDLFSNNQHLAPELPFDWWCGTFKSAIKDIHHTVLVLEPWHDPIPFRRAW